MLNMETNLHFGVQGDFKTVINVVKKKKEKEI